MLAGLHAASAASRLSSSGLEGLVSSGITPCAAAAAAVYTQRDTCWVLVLGFTAVSGAAAHWAQTMCASLLEICTVLQQGLPGFILGSVCEQRCCNPS